MKNKNIRINWKVLINCTVIVFVVAFIGSLFTDTGEWYSSIKPSITPPNYVFPIVWTILFILIALSLHYAWICPDKKQKKTIAILFGVNFFLNILWSYIYFGVRNTSFALVELIALWISILSLIIFNWKVCRKASYLLIPYLLWVSFAGVLNFLSIK